MSPLKSKRSQPLKACLCKADIKFSEIAKTRMRPTPPSKIFNLWPFSPDFFFSLSLLLQSEMKVFVKCWVTPKLKRIRLGTPEIVNKRRLHRHHNSATTFSLVRQSHVNFISICGVSNLIPLTLDKFSYFDTLEENGMPDIGKFLGNLAPSITADANL